MNKILKEKILSAKKRIKIIKKQREELIKH